MPRKRHFDYRVVFLNAPEKWLYRTKQQITAELGVPYLSINKSYLTGLLDLQSCKERLYESNPIVEGEEK